MVLRSALTASIDVVSLFGGIDVENLLLLICITCSLLHTKWCLRPMLLRICGFAFLCGGSFAIVSFVRVRCFCFAFIIVKRFSLLIYDQRDLAVGS